MGNIFNYITKYADNTFDEMPFNEVDAVMLSAIAYVDFSKIVNNDNKEVEMGLALEKFINRTDIKKYSKKGFLNKDLFRMCKMIKDKIRYRNIMLKNYVYILTKEEQFGAITMILPDKTKIIAYEGPDHNLVSWEEDFAMFYKYPVPADVDAIKYAKENISLFDKKVILLGHSKGGHLAMTATAFSPWYIRMKIDSKTCEINAYSNELKICRRFLWRRGSLKKEANILKTQEISKDISKRNKEMIR